MIRVVVDTNVLVSGLMGKQGSPAKLIFEAVLQARIQLIASAFTIAELEDVLNRPQITRYHKQSPEQIASIIDALVTASEIVVIEANAIHVSADPDDDAFLMTAVMAKADCIVSGDRHLKELEYYEGIPILSPREFASLHLNG